ncbi:MAG TPA: response regulator [Opitutaceae bacterium]|nr:response regulator [Opitutaceae bacterium]
MSKNKPIVILMAEDNATDIMLTKEALVHAKLLNTLHVVEDGIECLDFLHRRGKHAKAPVPDLILLDLNMPRKNGQEVLAEIKADPKLKHIPVVILTTSKTEEDVVKAYGLHANCYVIKPVDFDVFAEVVRSIQQFWFSVVTLPP